METKYKFMVLGILTLMVFATIAPSVLALPTETKTENREGSLFIETPDLRVKLQLGKPDIFFWAANQTKNSRQIAVFHVGFYYISELFGDDLIVDNSQELNGKMYNLASDIIEWDLSVENFTNEIRVTQTSSALDNGATISFVYHIYLEDVTVTQELDDSTITYSAKALSEVKFDIIIDNWVFSPGATGLALHVKIHDMQYKHRVRNGDEVNIPEDDDSRRMEEEERTNRTHEPEKYGVEFFDDDNRRAYFAWTPEADVFDANGTYIDTISCGASAVSYGLDDDFGKGREFAKEFINLFLVYPNYGDGNTLVHDPVIGIDDTQRTSTSWISLAALPIIAIAIIAIQRRRK